MALAVVSFVLEELGELAIDGVITEAKFLREVKEKVEDAKRELRSIRCFLKDADARVRNGDETLALLVEEINDAAYDLDDVVSTFVLTKEDEAEAAASKGVVDKVVDGLLLKRPIKFHNFGVEVDKILNRLSELKQSLERHGVWRDNNVGDSSSSNRRLNDLRRTYSHVPEDDFVENEGGMLELVSQLTKKKSGSPFVSIHGMGGLGKTTLAKIVYQHKDVRKHFNRFAWIFVSQQFQRKDIWKGVLLDLVSDPSGKEEIRKMEPHKFVKKLYDVLQKHKCLVVLDDVWDKNDWDCLKACFPENTTGSRILITTRRRDVAEHAARRGFFYQPPYLSYTASWELFKKAANFQEDATSRSDYEDMEKLGKDMIKYCGGLPLAIVVLGGLLSSNHTVNEWKTVRQNVKELVNRGQRMGEEEYNSVFVLLGLSYDELPDHLKPCFLHLANFPEDSEINVKELCRLWTAEGFVSVEDEARKCLMALVDRGMVEVGRRSSIVGRIKTCRMHDLMRDLCVQKAKEENILLCTNFQVPGDLLPTSNVRRPALAVQLDDDVVENKKREVKEKVEDARQELRRISCFLKDAEARAQNGDQTLALCVRDITDAAYDLDDVVSTFVLTEEAVATKGVVDQVVFGLLRERPIKLHKVGSEIDKILKSLNQSLQLYGVLRDNIVGNASSLNQRRNDLRRTYSHVPDPDFVENEGGMMELVTQLTKEGNSGSPFVSIHGMGGLGKTTLAKIVYHHKDVGRHFNRFAWVFVSQQFQPKDIWKGVLLDLVSDPSEKKEIRKMEDDELAKKLYDVLTKQKCLVVLDDVWQKADWDSLAKPAVPEKRTSSKILITTRRRDVAEHACRRGFLYHPQLLNFTASWELLKKKAYFQEDATSRSDYEDMEKLGKDMIKYCGGLPLAIVVLGGLLSTKHTAVEWEAVKPNVKELINKGQSNVSEQEYNTVSAVLGLSYDELPSLLKPCFLHLANFPEDSEINVKELCRLWTAEGFVPAEGEAHKCLMALVDRSLVQVGRQSSIVGRIKTCRIHNLMLDVCLKKAKKENFSHRINFQVPGDSLPTSKVRRLAVHSNDNIDDGLLGLNNNKDACLRSLLCFAPKVRDFNDVMKPLFNRFNKLRVLKFRLTSHKYDREEVQQIPEEIGELILLRFVSFNYPGRQFQLPPSMANLRCLETLDLRTSFIMHSIDLSSLCSMKVLSKLDHLRHLYLPWFNRSIEGYWIQLDNLTSLETLVNFDTSYCNWDDLSQLTKLNKLSIVTRSCRLGRINLASNLQSLSILGNLSSYVDLRNIVSSNYPHIQKLKLVGDIVTTLEITFFPNLVKLTLEGSHFDPMPMLGKLSKLRTLAVRYNWGIRIIVCCKDSFPQLESLSLDNLRRLEEWRVEEGALSKLCRLEMHGCEDLKSYPDGLRNITTLEEIKLTEMGEDFMRSFDQKGGDVDSTRRSKRRRMKIATSTSKRRRMAIATSTSRTGLEG